MKVIVTGGADGLGKAIVDNLTHEGHEVFVFDIMNGHDVRWPQGSWIVQEAIKSGKLDVLINCAGVNRINWLNNVHEQEYDFVMDTNAKGIFLMSQALSETLSKNNGTILNIVSNAAHMPMRCSAAYNASKAAALMLTKQMARELSPNVTVFSISPNKLAGTGMSRDIDEQVVKTRGWTHDQARDYQLSSLLTKEETPPSCVAKFIAFLLQSKENHKYLTGCDIPYGA